VTITVDGSIVDHELSHFDSSDASTLTAFSNGGA